MKNPVSYFIILLGMVFSFVIKAQSVSPRLDSVKHKVETALSDYFKRYPAEKIFLHTDENVYLTGQTIWYKAYAMAYGKPSQLSKIMYVNLYNKHGNLVLQDKLPLKNSAGHGDIILPDSLHTGWYRLQAFTGWMLNFDKEGFYSQDIYLQNKADRRNSPIAERSAKKYHISFFPEGGDLVDGAVANIAFKATDENGIPATVYGDLFYDKQKLPVKLVTLHDGMGSFELEANAGASYTAQVHLPDNSVQTVALPTVKKTGLSLRVNAAGTTNLEVRIAYADAKQPNKDIILEAVQNDGTSITYPLQLSRGINLFGVPKNNFNTGVLRLTVFNDSGVPEAERIVFINNNDQLKASLNNDSISFNPKGKNAFTLNLKNDKNQPVKGNLSVAVTDAAIGGEADDNIGSYFLMSSELHGYLHNPAYYFKNNDDTLRRQLDLVMLTNGWRHFKWDELLNGKPKPLKYFVEKKQFIAGKIENYHNSDNLKIKLMISARDSNNYMGYVEPDSTGNFVLNDYNHQGPANLNYTVVNSRNKKQDVKVTFMKPYTEGLTFTADTLSAAEDEKFASLKKYHSGVVGEIDENAISKSIMLKDVSITEHVPTPTEIVIKNHVQRLDLDQAFNLDLLNDQTVPPISIVNYIQGRFPGLVVTIGHGDSVSFKYHGTNTLRDGDEPFFYIDESRVDFMEFANTQLNDVALIRFAPPPVWFAPLNGGNQGALLVYTKRFGDNKGVLGNADKFNNYAFNGYSITREFSSPDYSFNNKSAPADYRTTLYWNHDLTTDEQGNAKIRFYNSDKAKKYRLVVQGMDANGKTVYLSEEIGQ